MLSAWMGRRCNGIGNRFQRLSQWLNPPRLTPHDLKLRAQQERIDRWHEAKGDDVLRFANYDLGPESVVLDLGAYHGQYGVEMFARYGCTVHLFEPCPPFADHIRYRLGKNPKFVLHEFGLASTTQTIALTIHEQGTSTFREGAEQVTGKLVRGADFFAEHRMEHVDVLKVNIEGGEYDILPHLIETGLVERIRHIQVQFHDDVVPNAEARMKKIQADLSRTHHIRWQHEWVWESWERNR